ncbi:UvrD-helicase domain-containing protein [Escherichia coli]
MLKALNLDEKHWAPRAVMGYINGKKDEGLRPGDILDLYGDPVHPHLSADLQDLSGDLQSLQLVDFAELLLRAHELWLNKPHILEHYRDRFPRTSWWTSFRIPTASSMPGCGCWRATAAR